MNQYSATEQPNPIQNAKPAVWELVQQDLIKLTTEHFARDKNNDLVSEVILRDMKDRDEWGRSKYKTPLQPFNGRDALVDFYQEVLDSAVYLRQFLFELNNDTSQYLDEYSTLLSIYNNILWSIYSIRKLILKRDGK